MDGGFSHITYTTYWWTCVGCEQPAALGHYDVNRGVSHECGCGRIVDAAWIRDMAEARVQELAVDPQSTTGRIYVLDERARMDWMPVLEWLEK
jgi:hypothetical protein